MAKIAHVQYEHIAEQPVFHRAMPATFDTVGDWLNSICHGKAPAKPIGSYRINLLESAGRYILFFYGVNTYQEGEKTTISRVEFEPGHMYCDLPEKEYAGLILDGIRHRLMEQLKDFTRTALFRESFIANADTVYAAFNGQKIWEHAATSPGQP